MTTSRTILVVEDESMIRDAVTAWFKKLGHEVTAVGSGRDAVGLFNTRHIDVVLLDLMLPDIPGEEVCKIIRKTSDVPVIMLTAKSSEDDIVNGLEIGADDYVLKPFSLRELQARIESVCGRFRGGQRSAAQPHKADAAIISSPPFVLDMAAHVLYKNSVQMDLTPIEWRLLSCLMTHPGTTFSRERLLDEAFGEHSDVYDRAVDTHIKNLRKKIEDDSKRPKYIKTVHGFGYKFETCLT